MKNKLSIIIILLLSNLIISCSDNDSYSSGFGEGSIGQGGSMARFTICNNYLYTVDNYTLKTFDISIPDSPVYLKSKDQNLGFDIETIFTMDTLLFIGSQSGMYIYNISRPEFPQQMAFVSHIKSCDPVVAQGNYAYVTLNSENTWCGRESNELKIYNIMDPYKPILLHTETGFVHPRGLGVDGEKLFICDNGLKVFNISNPEKPLWVDDLTHIPQANNIDTYDVIPLNGILLLIGADGLYQFDYKGEKLSFISKIEVANNLKP